MCTEPSSMKQRGISLIELIIFIVILGVGLAGILQVMSNVTSHSADPLLHKQALAVAESLLEEIELQDFNDLDTGSPVCPPASAVTAANRASTYHIVNCYNGFAMPAPPGITDINNAVVPGLTSYQARVAINNAALGAITNAGSAVLITVTVTDPRKDDIVISGYRTAY